MMKLKIFAYDGKIISKSVEIKCKISRYERMKLMEYEDMRG